ncbi:hypothetical protein HYALB_00001506 [Hymenoscyphus albidus]|uniref:Uncharacterized protein n=1 Tax=Hymenoscyphus albidus TaxID=595503 RepID=A0A9N9Q0J8_9HELO|nr:hypothetical protein HYALB_00001506 [Hymenoscyphus albidus]
MYACMQVHTKNLVHAYGTAWDVEKKKIYLPSFVLKKKGVESVDFHWLAQQPIPSTAKNRQAIRHGPGVLQYFCVGEKEIIVAGIKNRTYRGMDGILAAGWRLADERLLCAEKELEEEREVGEV